MFGRLSGGCLRFLFVYSHKSAHNWRGGEPFSYVLSYQRAYGRARQLRNLLDPRTRISAKDEEAGSPRSE